MVSRFVSKALVASGLALTLGGGAAAAQPGTVEAAAAQLAGRADVFAASSAALEVLPAKMAGSCPHSLMVQVDLAAAAPGKLAYQIETLDGRTSQVFEVRTRSDREGGFAARRQHEIMLLPASSVEESQARLAFSAPARPAAEPEAEPDFFERLFGTAAERDPSKGLSHQSFRVKVVAPNEVVSAFDSPSVSCDYNQMVRVMEDQRDGGRDRPGGDRPGRGGGRGGSAGAAGAVD